MAPPACVRTLASARPAPACRAQKSARPQANPGPQALPVSRREALWAALAAAPLLAAAPAGAAEAADGDSPLRSVLRAPFNFYRSRQQQNGGAKILAPVRASRAKLEAAAAALGAAPGPAEFGAALSLLRDASQNCYDFSLADATSIEAQSSLLQQKLRVANVRLADPCTYRLIYKNATSLTASKELVAVAGSQLDEVIRSFQLLDDLLDRAQQGDGEAAGGAPEVLQRCLGANEAFERLIQQCIGLDL